MVACGTGGDGGVAIMESGGQVEEPLEVDGAGFPLRAIVLQNIVRGGGGGTNREALQATRGQAEEGIGGGGEGLTWAERGETTRPRGAPDPNLEPARLPGERTRAELSTFVQDGSEQPIGDGEVGDGLDGADLRARGWVIEQGEGHVAGVVDRSAAIFQLALVGEAAGDGGHREGGVSRLGSRRGFFQPKEGNG